jgi:O-antigen/teichoic acid export membrane protein
MRSDQGRSLGSRAARGGGTVLAGQGVRIAVQTVSVMVLARLLAPADYGLLAIALAVVGFAEIFRDFGLSTAAVRAPELSDAQRDKLFWLNVAIGAGLTLVVVLLAPLAAAIFGRSELTDIVRALALLFLINGATAQVRADLNRRMKFGALVGTEIVGLVGGVGVAVAMALNNLGYWALVGQQLSGAALTMVLAAAMAGWLPRLPRRDVDVRPMVRFGTGLVGAQLVGYLSSNVDTLVIGLRFTPTDLGYYNRGYQLLMRPLNQVRAPTTQVALPVLNQLRDDTARTDEFVLMGQRALGYSLVAVTAFAAGAAEPIVNVFLGPGWSPVVPVFSLLAVTGGLTTLSYVGSWIYLSRGLTPELFRYSLVSLAIKIISVLVGSQWGVTGVAAGIVVAAALAWPLSLWWLSRITPIPLGGLYRGATRILGTAAAAVAATYLTVQATHGQPALVQLVAAAVATVAAYAFSGLLVIPVRRDMREMVRVGREALHR